MSLVIIDEIRVPRRHLFANSTVLAAYPDGTSAASPLFRPPRAPPRSSLHPSLRLMLLRNYLRSLPLLALGASAFMLHAADAPAPAATTLKDTFKNTFLVGVALNTAQFTDTDPRATALIAREFDSATAENAMKWDGLEPRNNEFDFEEADQFIAFCERHQLVVIGHNLCWHAQLPAWVSRPEPGQAALTRDVLLARVKNHVQTVARHFKGRVRGWDVVNEAINDGDGQLRSSVFLRVIGKEYLALAFKWAHEADPDAELYYNDYNLDADDKKRAAALDLVKYLREQGAPIHGIGLQGHYNLTTPTAAKIDETIQLFADLGLKVHITELDVEVKRDAAITGAVGATTGGTGPGANAAPAARPSAPPRPRFFPTLDAMKDKLALTDAQLASIKPLLEKATADLDAAIAAREFHRIGEIRGDTSDAIRSLLPEAQRKPFDQLMKMRGGFPPGPPPPPLSAEDQQALAQRYGEIFDVFMKHRAVIARVTFWGLRDADSWRRQSRPLIFGDDFERKPAYDAILASAKKAGL